MRAPPSPSQLRALLPESVSGRWQVSKSTYMILDGCGGVTEFNNGAVQRARSDVWEFDFYFIHMLCDLGSVT